jgi:hypothetical protein
MLEDSFGHKFTGRLLDVHAEGGVKERNVRKWFRLFRDGKTNVRDKKRSGRDSLVTDGKSIPLQAWTGPEGSRRLRLPDFRWW